MGSLLQNVARRTVPAAARERMVQWISRVRARFLPEPYRTVMPYTMLGIERLRTLRRFAEQIDQEGIPGDVVECGTCNGGSAAIMAQVAATSSLARHIYLFDSFEGLPPAGDKDGARAQGYTGLCRGAMDRVRAVLQALQVPLERVTLVKGWFDQTVPSSEVGRIALLHLDTDWYESLHVCLENLYDRVEPGGFVVLDDYGYWEGCRRAWHDFAESRALNVTLTPIDHTAVYFRKP
jgi:O-methyltransferase